MDVLKSLWTKEGTEEEVKLTYQYVFELRDKISETCKLAAEESERTAEKNKFYFEKHEACQNANVPRG